MFFRENSNSSLISTSTRTNKIKLETHSLENQKRFLAEGVELLRFGCVIIFFFITLTSFTQDPYLIELDYRGLSFCREMGRNPPITRTKTMPVKRTTSHYIIILTRGGLAENGQIQGNISRCLEQPYNVCQEGYIGKEQMCQWSTCLTSVVPI